MIAAVLLAAMPPLLFSQNFGEWLKRALIFLVVSYPCALVISAPLSFFGGIGGTSRKGILINGANYLEVLSKAEISVNRNDCTDSGRKRICGTYRHIPQGKARRVKALIKFKKVGVSKTMRIVRENIIFALLVKAVGPILHACGIAHMWFAVFADVGVMVLAVANAMRTMKKG